MMNTPETEQWEAYCDECYYHMWRLRRKNERGWNDGFHIHTGEEAKGLCDILNNLERERDEARELMKRQAEIIAEMMNPAEQRVCELEMDLSIERALADRLVKSVEGYRTAMESALTNTSVKSHQYESMNQQTNNTSPCECRDWCRDGRDMMSMHHPRCQHYTPPPADPRFARFGEAMWKYITNQGGDFCGEEISEDILPLAQAAGLCCRVPYDPTMHGEGIEADSGSEIWWWGNTSAEER